jgi:DNA-binding transcriptional LysR family regulator
MASDVPFRARVDGHPLSLRQLQYFSVIVDEGSFTRAAERLMVSQPSLSHQLKALEAAVGGPLLERLPRGVVATPMGRALLPRAREALEAVAAARREAQRARDLDFAELHLSTTLGVAFGLLPELLRAWAEDHPASRVTIVEQKHFRDVIADVDAGTTDAALAPTPTPVWHGPCERIGFEEMVLVCSPDDPRGADGDEVALTDFASDLWVLPSTDCGLAEPVASACAQAGFDPRPAVRTLSSATAVRLAAAGLGPTLVPISSASADTSAKLLRPRPLLGRELGVFGRPGSEDLVAALAATARAAGQGWIEVASV